MTEKTKYVILLVLLLVLAWLIFAPKDQSVGTTVIAQPSPELKGEVTAAVSPKVVRVYRDAVKKKLALPADVQADTNRQVATSSVVRSDIRSHTLTTVVDLSTGEFAVHDRAEPLPWVALTRRGEAGIAYGLKDGVQTSRIYLQQDLINIKSVSLGAAATLDQDGEWFVGLKAGYRW